jgi:hypothetical protein
VFGTIFLSQHSTQYVRHITTDVKCVLKYKLLFTLIREWFGKKCVTIKTPLPVHLLHLFIKMTDIVIFFEFLLSRLRDFFSFICHYISKSVLHTIYFVSKFEHPFFVTLSYDIIHSEHQFSTFRTSVLLVTNLR